MTRLAAADLRALRRSDQPLVSISLAAVQENFLNLTEIASANGAYTSAVLKADAYGLGMQQVAPVLWKVGARVFFVAHLSEALELRQILPDAAIYVLSGLNRYELSVYSHYRLIPVLNQLSEIELWLGHAASKADKIPAAVHIDTGMARLGLDEQDIRKLKEKAELLSAFSPLLYLTHLASAEMKACETNLIQFGNFKEAISGLPLGQQSIANSSGCFLPSDYALDLVRPGAAIYGINPTPERSNPMTPVVSLRAPILQTRTIAKGDVVGYGSTWTAKNKTRIATISIGYADGLLRSLSNTGRIFIDGVPCPIVGRVSMDLITVEVTHLRPEQSMTGVQAEIIGPNQTLDDIGESGGTIGYEILTSLGNRFARTYVDL
ncbi:MAG: alanine racemase [Alphaproteobacteria bacterium]